jgi:magnesium chelatase subunit I
LARALLAVWRRNLGHEDFGGLIAEFDGGLQVETHDLMKSDDFLEQFPPTADTGSRAGEWMRRLGAHPRSPAERASALEFCLEGLHLVKRINKLATGEPGRYTFGRE